MRCVSRLVCFLAFRVSCVSWRFLSCCWNGVTCVFLGKCTCTCKFKVKCKYKRECECNARVVERATSMGVGMRAGTTWQDGKERHKASRPPALACLCACTCACACMQEGGLVGGCSRKAVGLPHSPIACACTAGACVRVRAYMLPYSCA